MFFNAAVQGLNQMWKLAKNDPAKMTKWMSGYMAIGALNAILHALIDDDDDYLDMPEFTRRNNLILGGKGVYLKWALPQESRMFYAMGDMIVNRALGREPHVNAFEEVCDMITDVLPLGGGGGLKSLAPSVAQPVLDNMTNSNFAGYPIYPDNKYLTDEEKERTPKWQKTYNGTGKIWIDMSKVMNIIGGGDEDDAGWRYLNVHPESIKHVFEGIGGGTLTTLYKFGDTIESLAEGETPQLRRVPFVNRVVIDNGEQTRNSYVNAVYDYWEAEALHTKKKLKSYEKSIKECEQKIKDAVDEDTRVDNTLKATRYREKLDKLKASDGYQVYLIFEASHKRIDAMNKDIWSETDGDAKRGLMRSQDDLKRVVINDIAEFRKNKDRQEAQSGEEVNE